MFQCLYLTVLLLTAVCSQNDLDHDLNNDLDPKVSNIAAIPGGSVSQPPLSPSPPPPPPPQPSTTITTQSPLDVINPVTLSNAKGEKLPGLVVVSKSIVPSRLKPAASCSFSVGPAESYRPQTKSFGYPESVIEQALRGTVAEQALFALQEAKMRSAYATTTTTTNKNNNGDMDGNSPLFGAAIPKNDFGISGDPSSLRPFPSVAGRSPINGLSNIKGINLQNPLAEGGGLAGSSGPSLATGRISNNMGGSTPVLTDLLRNLDSGSSNRNNDNVFSLGAPATQESPSFSQDIEQLFPGEGDSSRFPQYSFFNPQGTGNPNLNRAASSPIGFNGFQAVHPLAAITGGRGNDVMHDIKGDGGGQMSPFDGLDPFQRAGDFPVPRRTKREAKQSRAKVNVSGVCDSQPKLLRQYSHFGGVCYVIRPQLQQLTFVTCSNAECSKCRYPEGATRCLPESRGVAVWAYCQGGPFAQGVGLDFIHLPVACSCKTMACS